MWWVVPLLLGYTLAGLMYATLHVVALPPDERQWIKDRKLLFVGQVLAMIALWPVAAVIATTRLNREPSHQGRHRHDDV